MVHFRLEERDCPDPKTKEIADQDTDEARGEKAEDRAEVEQDEEEPATVPAEPPKDAVVTHVRVEGLRGEYWTRQGVVEEGSVVLRYKGQVLEGMSRLDLLMQMRVDGHFMLAEVGTPVAGYLKGPAEVVFRKVLKEQDASGDADPNAPKVQVAKVTFPKEKITKQDMQEVELLAQRERAMADDDDGSSSDSTE